MLLKEDLFLIGAVLWAVGIVTTWILKKAPRKIVFWSVVYFYVIGVLAVTLFPIPYDGVETMYPVPNNLIPFHSISAGMKKGITRTVLMQIGGNIALSIPYGVLLYLVSRKKGIYLLLRTLLFPFIIEYLQLIVGCIVGIKYRSFDVDDFILNTIGVYMGYILGKLILRPYREKIRTRIF